jgi:hypothetical protein
LLTPHMAGHGPYLNDRRFQIIVDNCRAFAGGRHPGRDGSEAPMHTLAHRLQGLEAIGPLAGQQKSIG